MSKRFIVTLATLLIIAGAAGGAIMLTKGYSFSPKDGKVVGSGIIAVASVPDGASVYIDGHLTTATNTTISQLKPKSYNIKIIKEGFIPWEKNIEVKEGLVSEIKASLFPALPTIYPLTYNGVVNATLSPDGQKLAFAVPMTDDSHNRQKGGIWVWTMTSQPISFTRGAEPHQITVSTTSLDFSKSKFSWSPDSKQLLLTMQEGGQTGDAFQRNYLLTADKQISLADLRDITPIVAGTVKSWEDDQKVKDEARIATINDAAIRQIASASASIQWSPDETKFVTISRQPSLVIGKTPGLIKGSKVYDLVTGKNYDLPEALGYQWLPDSKHVILIQEAKVAIAEFDGNNTAVVFAGKYEGQAIYPWPDSSRIAVVTSFSTPTALQPNLFGINLK